jgi:DNA-binding transcriptional ArsR family regulator
VVEHRAPARLALDEHQLQRWLGDREVGVSRPPLGGLHPEQGPVEVDRPLSEVFELTGPTISHHLRVLREACLITGERRGTWIYYRVQPDALRLASEVLAPGTAHA